MSREMTTKYLLYCNGQYFTAQEFNEYKEKRDREKKKNESTKS